MATSKSLQTPSIVEVLASTIRVGHPATSNNTKIYLRSPVSVAGATLSVSDNNNLANGDQLVVGTIADPLSEAVLINGSVTFGSALSIATTLAFSHDVDCEITKVYERSIKIYGAATSGGSLTLITTITIQWDKPFSEYTLLTSDTAYAYYVAKFTDGTTDGSASSYVIAAGLTYLTVETFIQQALASTNSQVDENLLPRPMLVQWIQDAQSYITQFTYQDPVTGMYKQKDWSFEVIEDKTSISLVQNENEYLLSLLTNTIKYPNSQKAIIDVRIGSQRILRDRSIDEYDNIMAYRPRTTVATTPSIGATSLVVTDASEFSTGGGTVTVGVDTLTYTSVSTNTLTGIPASGTGSITTAYTVGTAVWQNLTQGLPSSYTIFNGVMKLDRPVSAPYAGQKLKIRYLYAIPRITSNSDTTVIPFANVFQNYLAAQIERRKGNEDKYGMYMEVFQKQVLNNALADMIPVNDEFKYHNYNDDFVFDALNLNSNNYYNFS